MKITVFGTGYVGLVQAAVLAESGHEVVCVDIDRNKIEQLKRGEVTIFEPGLERLVTSNQSACRLHFTTDAAEGVLHGKVIFIAVGTPPDEDGSADVTHVLNVAESIATHMDGERVIAIKSTVPMGTCDRVAEIVEPVLRARGVDFSFSVAANPEFLKEGSAVADCMKPDRIIIGTSDEKTARLLRELYAPFNRNHEKIILMDSRSAELTKYAANAMLATKITLMNEIAGLAQALGADIEKVRHGIGSDPRIGYDFIYAGIGFGGACFPKDLRALIQTAREAQLDHNVLKAVAERNSLQPQILVNRIVSYFNGNITGKTFALWGLSYKPNTNDMREAPSRAIIEALWKQGARVQAFDPKAMDECRRIYGNDERLRLCSSKEATLSGADALVIATEWRNFLAPSFESIRLALSTPVIFDGRNIYDPQLVARHGLHYHCIGRLLYKRAVGR